MEEYQIKKSLEGANKKQMKKEAAKKNEQDNFDLS